MIDFKRFATVQEAVVPIVNGWGQVHTRKVFSAKTEDGWYKVSLGDKTEVIRPASPLEIDKALVGQKKVRVYALGNEGVPLNFDPFKRAGMGESVIVHFLNLPAWEVAKVARWEDGRFYFIEADRSYERKTLQQVKEAFDSDQGLVGISGVAPELRHYYLVLSLQRAAFREFQELERLRLSEEERKARIAEFEKTFAGRLNNVIEGAGGTLVAWEKYGTGYLVTWKVKGSRQNVRSHIRDDMRIINAGFCLSGEDQKHSMASIVQLASLFETEVVNPHTGRTELYITTE